jgi:hypothetical protein
MELLGGRAWPGAFDSAAGHFGEQYSPILSLIVGDLAGAYNEIGIRQWFGRERTQLGGRAPSDWLKPRWKPAQPGPHRVHDLARALVASPAT